MDIADDDDGFASCEEEELKVDSNNKKRNNKKKPEKELTGDEIQNFYLGVDNVKSKEDVSKIKF
jgi:hypothetical protein